MITFKKFILLMLFSTSFVNTHTSDLLKAVQSGKKDQVELLLQRGVDVNYTYDRVTALEEAAALGNMNAVRLLLNNNANPNIGIPLVEASYQNVEMVTLLLKYGANPNQEDPIYGATTSGHGNIQIYKLIKRAKALDAVIMEKATSEQIKRVEKIINGTDQDSLDMIRGRILHTNCSLLTTYIRNNQRNYESDIDRTVAVELYTFVSNNQQNYTSDTYRTAAIALYTLAKKIALNMAINYRFSLLQEAEESTFSLSLPLEIQIRLFLESYKLPESFSTATLTLKTKSGLEENFYDIVANYTDRILDQMQTKQLEQPAKRLKSKQAAAQAD